MIRSTFRCEKDCRRGAVVDAEAAEASRLEALGLEVATAVHRWRQRTGREYPPFTEMVKILESLGWRKTDGL